MKKKYNTYIKELSKSKFKSRYEGKENFFHASGSGLCIRKHYFGSVLRLDRKEPDNLSRLRLGDIVHDDIQNALKLKSSKRYITEEEIIIPEYNVRGFFDVLDLEKKKLIDIKTIGGYKWQNIFGRNKTDSVHNYKLQLGTYAIGVEKKYNIKLRSMSLMFYKLGDPKAGDIRELPVSLMYKSEATKYWSNVIDTLKECDATDTLPELSLGASPAESWECNPQWCGYFKQCLGGLKPELL